MKPQVTYRLYRASFAFGRGEGRINVLSSPAKLEEIQSCCSFQDQVRSLKILPKKPHTTVCETSRFNIILNMKRSPLGRRTITDSGRGSFHSYFTILFLILSIQIDPALKLSLQYKTSLIDLAIIDLSNHNCQNGGEFKLCAVIETSLMLFKSYACPNKIELVIKKQKFNNLFSKYLDYSIEHPIYSSL